ncbi:hypothetical protein PsorP6_010558 [Peronosclerospora sorghi]|uniref:Uncharacterized protein n=1 Tax=Peronosclerospora sorghi TaxID=230839 RepID=A0ACC0VWV4_9STRA|nr:hypothetical protein PsorP6_010558 [Peronosclerospora sorghi]
MLPNEWRPNASEDGEYTLMLFQPDPPVVSSTQSLSYQHVHSSTLSSSINQALSDEDMLDEIFQEIMSPPDSSLLPSSNLSVYPSTDSSAPSTPQLTSAVRSSASIGSISPNMAAALRVPTFPIPPTTRSPAFLTMMNEAKSRHFGGYASMLFTSPTASTRRNYRRTHRSTRVVKKKPASRICRMPGCTKGIRSRGLCKAHGGGRRCTTPGCEISDQGGGHCIAHGGGRRCSIAGCQKSAQSKGLCKLHGGARLCRLPECNKNGQIKGLCRLHYSLTLATKSTSGGGATKGGAATHTPSGGAFELRI